MEKTLKPLLYTALAILTVVGVIAVNTLFLSLAKNSIEKDLGAATNVPTNYAKLNGNNTWSATNTYTGYTTGLSEVLYGDGSDGNVTISANATATKDMYFNNLTINNGVVYNTGNFKIFVKDTLTNNGTINNNGGNGGNGGNAAAGVVGAIGTGSPAFASGTLPFNTAGSNGAIGVVNDSDGNNGNGGNSTSYNLARINGVSAGNSGNSTGCNPHAAKTGGSGGTALSTSTIQMKNVYDFNFLEYLAAYTRPSITAGAAGGASGSCSAPSGCAGGAESSGGGGGGGASGGILFISASKVVNNGTLESNGGKGGNAGTSYCASNGNAGGSGGGAGGNGGIVLVIYKSLLATGTMQANGGLGGNLSNGCVGNASAGNGTNGSTGNSGLVWTVNLK